MSTGVDVPTEAATGALGVVLPSPGIYLVRVDTPVEMEPPLTLSLNLEYPGVKLVDLPIRPGASFQTVGTDGATTVSFTSTVPVDRPRVDACGELIDAFQIDLDGRISQPSEVSGRRIVGDFTASYTIAPPLVIGRLILKATRSCRSECCCD